MIDPTITALHAVTDTVRWHHCPHEDYPAGVYMGVGEGVFYWLRQEFGNIYEWECWVMERKSAPPHAATWADTPVAAFVACLKFATLIPSTEDPDDPIQ